MNVRSLVARHHQSFNDRDLDGLSTVFDEDVEIVVDGRVLHGIAAALGYSSAIFREFPRLRIDDAHVVAESGDTIVVEHQMLNGDPSGGPLRPQGSVCGIYRARDGRIVAWTSYYMPEGADREDVVNVPSRAEGTKLAEEEAALRRMATLVARGVSQDELFAAVNEEVGRLVGADATSLMRFEADDTVTLVAAWSAADADFPIGARRPVDDALRAMRDHERGLRCGPSEPPPVGPFVEEAPRLAIRAAVGVPIVVDGRVWGAAFAASTGEEPFPEATETRLAQFTELLATAIANAESRDGLARLAEEQTALRRVATLVADGAAPEDVFATVADEVGRLLSVDMANMGRYEPDQTVTFVASAGERFPVGSRWPLGGGGTNLAAIVLETGGPARIHDYADATDPIAEHVRDQGVRSAVGTPIIVEGRLWGVMTAGSSQEQPLPPDTETRLTQFTELLATAVANAESRAGLARLAAEQGALRRVAMLVARGTRPEEVFAAVADEVGRLLSVELANVCRYESDGTLTFVASAGERRRVGSRWSLGGQKNLATLVLETGRPGRIDNYADATGPLADDIRGQGVRSAVGTPINVEGRLWGLITAASSQEQPLPPDTEARLASFTELVATAIANTDARTEVGRLVDEHAALRRVATLVAEGAAPFEVFETVTREVGVLSGADLARMERYESGDSVIGVAGWSRGDAPELAVGTRFSLEGTSIAAMVHQASRPVRVDSFADAHGPIAQEAQRLGIRSSVGCPIVVDGRLWGVIAASSKTTTPFPPDTESQIAGFTELVATAIANTEAHATANRLTGEQAALRRVATLVAKEAAPADMFAKVAEAVANVIGQVDCVLWRAERDGTVSVIGAYGAGVSATVRVGERFPVDGTSVVASVLSGGRPCRIDDYAGITGTTAERGREHGIRSAAGCPIVVRGHTWGVVAVARYEPGSLAPETETRITQFTDLVATAIANAEARAEVERLAEEQAALHRVAALVASGIGPEPVFRAVADEVKALVRADMSAIVRFEADATAVVIGDLGRRRAAGASAEMDAGYLVASVRETGHAARFDTDDPAAADMPELVRALGIRSGLASPIVVDGELWGAITVASVDRPLPAGTEQRLADFTELMAAAISNAQAREDLRRLADEQAALRRAATLVAREASQAEVFTAIADEVGQLLGAEDVRIYRYEDDHSVVVVGASGYEDFLPVGSRHPLGGTNSASLVFRTGQAARIDDYETAATGSIGDQARSSGIRSIAAAPILVEGRLWGAIAVGTGRLELLPPETEARLGQFTELTATAIANTESHARADRLADEQAALRRVATFVAEASPLEEVFAKVAEEVTNALGDVDCALWRDEGDASASAVAVWGASVAAGVRVGTRITLDGESVTAHVLREGRPWRIGDYSGVTGTVAERAREIGIRSAVGCPIVVGGRIWGVMAVASSVAAFPPDTESRIAQFSELVATAIANIEARAEVQRLAEEQAALRRVATLVAEGARPAAVFDAVAAEMERLLDAEQVSLGRYEPGDELTVVAHRGPNTWLLPPGSRLSHEGENVTATVRRTERSARMETFEDAPGSIARVVRAMGMRSSVGAPIVVDGRLWGVITARWSGADSPPADTEDRMAQFAQLLDTAIANADSHDQLTASRARLLTEGDEARRRVVRDLHDGAQQRLVHTIITLKLVQRALRAKDARADSLVGEALAHAEQSNVELRELAHGILPAVLSRGLEAAIDEVVMRLDLAVRVDVSAERFPEEIEASAYFIVVEALTNVVKHAHAGRVEVTVSVQDGMLHVEVQDDGIGGADPNGHGLVGIYDRVTALGGRLKIESPASGGTLVTATLPVSAN